MAQYTPFPTFGGPKEGGGIMNVKLSPTQMRFPTARRPANREPLEISTKDKLAPLLPLAVEGLMGLFKGQPTSDQDYLKSLSSGFVENPETLDEVKQNQKVQAQIDTYNQYGAPEQPSKGGFGMTELAHLIAAGSLDQGSINYGKSYMSMRNAKRADKTSKINARGSFLTKQLEQDAYQLKTFFDLDEARLGNQSLVDGIFNPTDGKRYAYTEKGLTPLGDNYIEYIAGQGGTNISNFSSKQNIALKELTDEFKVKDAATISVVRVANDLIIDNLDPAINGETIDPASITAAFVNLGNRGWNEFNNMAGLYTAGTDGVNTKTADKYFSNTKDGGSGSTAYNSKGTGYAAKDLAEILTRYADDPSSITEAELDIAINGLSGAYEEVNRGKKIEDLFKGITYNQVATKASFLQLAYMFASANGQTGRTLSDKDLAYHLEIVGSGASNDSEVLKTNLLRAVDSLISGNDNDIQVRLNKGDMRQYSIVKNENGKYSKDANHAIGLIDMYYDPSVNPDGEEKWDDYVNYNFSDFRTRYGVNSQITSRRGNLLLDEWNNHESPIPSFYNRTKSKTNKPQVIDGVTVITPPPPIQSNFIEEKLGG